MRTLLAGLILVLVGCGQNQAPPSCADDPCDPNATCTQDGSSVTCACDVGYTGDGETCAAVTCDPLTSPMNGNVNVSNTMVGGTATYSCDAPLRPDGEATRTCQVDGTWSGVAPTCVPCQTAQRTLTAVQSGSVQYAGDVGAYSYQIPDVVAYSNPTGDCGTAPPCDITGWMGFDLSAIPDTAVIQAMSLHAFATLVALDPMVRLQYSSINNWTRESTPPAQLVRTIPEVSVPVALTAANQYKFIEIPVDINATSWTVDLVDNWLTLGVHNPRTAYSYVYFSGVDMAMPDKQPYLQVTYCN